VPILYVHRHYQLYTSYGTQSDSLTPLPLPLSTNHLIIIILRVIYTDLFVRGPFCLPEVNPVNSQRPNYVPVAVKLVLTYTLGYWVISTRRWFAELSS
jgi:hypothetical protein